MSYLRSAAHRSTKEASARSIRALRRNKTMRRAAGHVRYAVVGLGHIAQVAVLPAFRHASRNSKLAALFSDDKVKLRELKQKYHVPVTGSYEDYEAVLRAGGVEAV